MVIHTRHTIQLLYIEYTLIWVVANRLLVIGNIKIEPNRFAIVSFSIGASKADLVTRNSFFVCVSSYCRFFLVHRAVLYLDARVLYILLYFEHLVNIANRRCSLLSESYELLFMACNKKNCYFILQSAQRRSWLYKATVAMCKRNYLTQST